MIDVENLTKIYPNGQCALNAINLQVADGVFGLLGPNGAGKTTLMRILATLLRPTKGRVVVFGNDLATSDGRDKTRNLLGYLPQDTGLHPELTVEQELDYIAILKRVTPAAARAKQIASVLEQVDLSDVRRERVRTLSGGMKRRLGIAIALLGTFRLLIVDEPTAGLDPTERVHFRNLLHKLAGDRVIILSTHLVEDISQVCTDLAVLYQGGLLFHGAPKELITRLEGKVWSISGNRAKLALGVVEISSKTTTEGIERRVLADEIPAPAACSVNPTMEDAYLWLIQQEHGRS